MGGCIEIEHLGWEELLTEDRYAKSCEGKPHHSVFGYVDESGWNGEKNAIYVLNEVADCEECSVFAGKHRTRGS